jgi:hypothetical protein
MSAATRAITTTGSLGGAAWAVTPVLGSAVARFITHSEPGPIASIIIILPPLFLPTLHRIRGLWRRIFRELIFRDRGFGFVGSPQAADMHEHGSHQNDFDDPAAHTRMVPNCLTPTVAVTVSVSAALGRATGRGNSVAATAATHASIHWTTGVETLSSDGIFELIRIFESWFGLRVIGQTIPSALPCLFIVQTVILELIPGSVPILGRCVISGQERVSDSGGTRIVSGWLGVEFETATSCLRLTVFSNPVSQSIRFTCILKHRLRSLGESIRRFGHRLIRDFRNGGFIRPGRSVEKWQGHSEGYWKV